MDFGEAVRALKDGKCVARSGWNGKNMHLYLEDAFVFPIREGHFRGENRSFEPCIIMFTAQGKHQPGWLASQADIMATDWFVVEPK